MNYIYMLYCVWCSYCDFSTKNTNTSLLISLSILQTFRILLWIHIAKSVLLSMSMSLRYKELCRFLVCSVLSYIVSVFIALTLMAWWLEGQSGPLQNIEPAIPKCFLFLEDLFGPSRTWSDLRKSRPVEQKLIVRWCSRVPKFDSESLTPMNQFYITEVTDASETTISK